MKTTIPLIFFISQVLFVHALQINEIMSNPVGDDGGREWVEVYNNTENDVLLTGLTVSIKGGSFVLVTPVSGGTSIAPHGYAIIGSVVSGATKFLLDYPAYSGPLFRSAISLVNTGVTSIEFKIDGVSVDILPSYTAAKEGSTYSRIGGTFMTTNPTPGQENILESSGGGGGDATTTDPSGTQKTISQMSPPSADITIYLPAERTVVAGAPSVFSVYALTHDNKNIDTLKYKWSFGEGGESTGSTTMYRYLYPGRYVTQVEASNGTVAGVGRMIVRVVAPDIEMSSIETGKYGNYIDITNPNKYDLDISDWKIVLDDTPFSFPRNTILLQGITRIPLTMKGFASTTIASSTLIKILFPTMEEVLRVQQRSNLTEVAHVPMTTTATTSMPALLVTRKANALNSSNFQKSNSVVVDKATSSKILVPVTKKDTRIASLMRSLFGK